MADRETVAAAVYQAMADAFGKDAKEFEDHPELRLREDLAAKSMEYFPMIMELEEKLGISIEFHDFQTMTTTVGKAVDYVLALAMAQGK